MQAAPDKDGLQNGNSEHSDYGPRQSFRSVASTAYSTRSSQGVSEDWGLNTPQSRVESNDFISNGPTTFNAATGSNVGLSYPFNKLACMDEAEFDLHRSLGKDPKKYTAMVDSSRRESSNDDEPSLSRNTSLQTVSSLGTNGSMNGVSRSSLIAPGQNTPSEGRKFRQTNSTLGESILEEPVKEEIAIAEPVSSKKLPMMFPFPEVNGDGPGHVSEIDRAFEFRGKRLKLPETYPQERKIGKRCGRPDKRFRILDPFSQFRGNKKKMRHKSQCKWDVFPGITDPRVLATPFHKGNLADPRHLGFIAMPFRSGHFADPRQLKHLVSPFSKKSKVKAMDSWASSDTKSPENRTQDSTGSSTTESDEKENGVSSPTGPLSVGTMSSMHSNHSDNMEMQLTKTFGHDQLAELEASEMASKGQNAAEDDSTDPSSHGSWQAKIQDASEPQKPSHFNSAPFLKAMEKIKEAIPESIKTKRTHTAPQLQHAPSSLKETGRLRVEKFRGITFVNEYALVRTLGRGTFGTVKLALNTTNHELYALKLLPKSRKARSSHRGSHTADADVLREIDVMKQMDHPNIVRLHEVIDDPLNSKMLMVLEYTEGGSLFSGSKINPNKRLTELSARKYFRDVLTGLDYLHANRVAHGDLKPDNLLLSSAGAIKIADFGSSQLTRRGEVVKRTTGTPAFMAPELCSGEAYHARSADVWALGVCLYMFVFGAVPFKADSILGLYEAIQSDRLEFPDDIYISDSLKHLLLRLLDKDPENRISLIGAMHHPWVTHNGGYPLPNVQGLENDEYEDRRAMLMECWPDNPCNINLGHILQVVAPLFEERIYADGTFLAKQGERAKCIFFLQEGETIIYHTKNVNEGIDSDDEEEEEDHANKEVVDKRQRLKREGSMLKTMFCATITASRLVSAVRDYASGTSKMISTRGPGSFIGEVMFYASGQEATWQTCVRAKGPVRALVLHYQDVCDLISKRPEVESDIRATMAQRQGELMKMEMLEKLASLHRDLIKEVKMATAAGGASVSAIETARGLLGCEKYEEALRARASGLSTGQMEMPASCTYGLDPPDAEYLGKPEESQVRKEESRESVEESCSGLEPRSSSASSVRSSINEKGDSAKNLSAFDPGKSPLKLGPQENHAVLSPVPSQDFTQ